MREADLGGRDACRAGADPDDLAYRLVNGEQCPHLLLDAGGVLAAQDGLSFAHVRLVVTDDGLAAPALRVAARQVERGVLLDVEQVGDQAEQLGGIFGAAAGGQAESSEVFCLVTDLLDPGEYPALDLACCYPERWGCETVIGRHKTDMGEGQPVLRSRDPAGVAQEMWALFAVYQALCRLAGIGAAAAGISPSRISFPHVLQAATDTVAAFPP